MSTGIFNNFNGYHHRRSIRLQGYDYSRPGYYFITICIHDPKKKLFGDVVNGEMVVNDAGKMVQKLWHEIPDHYPNVALDEFQVMPNHLHGIVVITKYATTARVPNAVVGVQNFEPLRHWGNDGRHVAKNQYQHIIPGSIGSIMRGFKTGVTKWYRTNYPGGTLWHRNFYEHIIRDEQALYYIRKYIRNNPKKWAVDHECHLDGEIDALENGE